jgi:hypothetical protein
LAPRSSRKFLNNRGPNNSARKIMASYPTKIQIDEEHSRAICAEIGDRLRIALGDPLPIPPDLARLIARLGELDEHNSPSIAPSIEGVSPSLGSQAISSDRVLLEA